MASSIRSARFASLTVLSLALAIAGCASQTSDDAEESQGAIGFKPSLIKGWYEGEATHVSVRSPQTLTFPNTVGVIIDFSKDGVLGKYEKRCGGNISKNGDALNLGGGFGPDTECVLTVTQADDGVLTIAGTVNVPDGSRLGKDTPVNIKVKPRASDAELLGTYVSADGKISLERKANKGEYNFDYALTLNGKPFTGTTSTSHGLLEAAVGWAYGADPFNEVYATVDGCALSVQLERKAGHYSLVIYPETGDTAKAKAEQAAKCANVPDMLLVQK